jgi:rubrerythrin
MLIHADSTPAVKDQIEGVGWVCKTCGTGVNEPSALLGCAWCMVCDQYDKPIQAVAA